MLCIPPSYSIACISCPTLYVKLKEMIRLPGCVLTLLEYNRRFECHSDFVFYDYKEPLKLPDSLQANLFDVVVVDPPFLSEECLTKAAMIMKHLAKDKIILCTGAVMEDVAKQVLDVTPCKFVPKHVNNLANEFLCYLNYKSDHLYILIFDNYSMSEEMNSVEFLCDFSGAT